MAYTPDRGDIVHLEFDPASGSEDAKIYDKLGNNFVSHENVNHSAKEYAPRNVTTNTVEATLPFSHVACMMRPQCQGNAFAAI